MGSSRRRASSSPRRGRGFTLLELIAVLFIAALAFVLVPGYFDRGMAAIDLKSAARQVASGLRSARNAAIATRQETRFILDTEQKQFRVDRDGNVYALPERVSFKMLTGEAEVIEKDKVAAIRFFADGSATGGEVQVANGERKYLVRIDWMTGQVKILEPSA